MAKTLTQAKKRRGQVGFLFILPLLVYFLIFQLAPILISFFISFTNWNGRSPTFDFVGFKNYMAIFTDRILYPNFWKSLGTTFKFMLITVPLSIVLATFVAAILNSKIKGERFFKTAFYIPAVTAGTAISAIWLFLLDPTIGAVGFLNKTFGSHINLLGKTDTALITLGIMAVWGGLGYNVLIILSAMKNINPQLYEACEVDGGGFFRQFFTVTIPGIMPTLYFMIITSVIGSLQAFDQMYLMTGGGPEGSTTTFMLTVYKTMFEYEEAGVASAMSYFLFFIIIVITVIQSKIVPQGYQTELNLGDGALSKVSDEAKKLGKKDDYVPQLLVIKKEASSAERLQELLEKRRRENKRKIVLHKIGTILKYAILTLLAFAFIFPYLWLISNSFKDPAAIFSAEQFSLIPRDVDGKIKFVISNYKNAVEHLNLGKVFVNTLIVCSVNTVVNLLFNALAGYAFARLKFKGRDITFKVMILSIMIPGTIMTIPNLLICRLLKIDDTLLVLILPFVMSIYNVFLMRQQFYNLPDELEEAAILDGAGPLKIFFRISLPLVTPMMVVLGITTFMWNYNNFLWTLVSIQSPENFTLARSLGDLVSAGGSNPSMYPIMLAGSVLVSLPLVIIFFALQKYIVGGLTTGAVKG
ncbi:MAG: L-arabinose transport system permease protein AraQ [Tenericutes bacterium ADurb.Bin087]|nr:MAG: L-arabinose transport system permease protein AraQ [Tenericutes bacterium ADurb.Bin087]